MNPFIDEDMVRQRFLDLQREAENRRLAAGAPDPLRNALRRLITRAWLLAGLAMQRQPRRRPRMVPGPIEGDKTETEVA